MDDRAVELLASDVATSSVTGLLAPGGAARVRETMLGHDFTGDAIDELLGAPASAALARRELLPALRATAGGSPLETLVRLFRIQVPVSRSAAEAALPLADASPLLTIAGDEVRAALEIQPVTVRTGDGSLEWFVVSDQRLTAGPSRPDHVLGIGGSSMSLGLATVREPVGSALDIGAGGGIQSLHLSRYARSVTATDVSPRATRFAATTFALSEVDVEVVEGDMTEPVKGRRFDQIVSNPPFVISPGHVFDFRDSGQPPEALVRRLVRDLPDLLPVGGTAQLLANWLHIRGEDWAERVAEWFVGLPCDVWVLQREVTDPGAYVSVWLTDAGQIENEAAYRDWLDLFDRLGAEAVGFGLITMRRVEREGVHQVEHLHAPMRQPIAPAISGWLNRTDFLASHPGGTLLTETLVADRSSELWQRARLDDGGWQVELFELRQTGPIGWSAALDRPVVALVEGCDGSVPLGAVIDTVITGVETDARDAAIEELTAAATVLVRRGFLVPLSQAAPERSPR
jgi:methylase of polypeptide subunit release factors